MVFHITKQKCNLGILQFADDAKLPVDGRTLYSKGSHQARKMEQQNAHRKELLLEYQFHAVIQVKANLVGGSSGENLAGLRRHRFLIIKTDT